MNFSEIKEISIPQGKVTKVECDGIVLYEKKNTVPIIWLENHHVGYAVGSDCTPSSNSDYYTCEVIPVEYGKSYTAPFSSTVNHRWVGVDANNIVTEVNNTQGLNTWTPTNQNTVGLRFRGYMPLGSTGEITELIVS